MKTILILSDTLNRHFLPAYGNDWVKTPNIDRLAAQSVTFDNHWLGSAPCMPARRDILTGRLNFMEKAWGGMEPFDRPLTRILRENGIFSHMVTATTGTAPSITGRATTLSMKKSSAKPPRPSRTCAAAMRQVSQ